MTEPDAGTDVANYKTNADINGDKLRLNGVKTLISRADEAGMFVVFTRVNKQPGRAGIGCVLVEKNAPGLFVSGRFHTMGGEYLPEVRFEDCELPVENLVVQRTGFRACSPPSTRSDASIRAFLWAWPKGLSMRR